MTRYDLALKIGIVLGFFGLYTLLNKFFRQSVYAILLSAVVILIIKYVLERYNLANEDKNKSIFNKLNDLQQEMNSYIETKYKNLPVQSDNLYKKVKLDYMYSDANLISFLHHRLYLSKYNKDSYSELVKKVNLFLKLKYFYEIKEQRYKTQLLETLNQLKKEIVNIFHTFIYTVPKMTNMYTDLYTSRNVLHTLLNVTVESKDIPDALDPNDKYFDIL